MRCNGNVSWAKFAANRAAKGRYCADNTLTDYDSPPNCASEIPASGSISGALLFGNRSMKIRNSLKSLKNRHRDCRVIRRRGRTYVINKTNRRFKARQG